MDNFTRRQNKQDGVGCDECGEIFKNDGNEVRMAHHIHDEFSYKKEV